MTGYPCGTLRGWPRADEWDRVVKVKYGDIVKRFNDSSSINAYLHGLPALRLKIASDFKFSADVEFNLTYIDEDGDVVMLDDDNDLRDAVLNQKLNPLRINLLLKSINVGATHQATNSKSVQSEDTPAKNEHASLCPSVESSSGGVKSNLKRGADTKVKIRFYDQFGHGKGKSVVSSVPPDAAHTQRPVLVPSMGEKKLTYAPSPRYTTYGSNGTANGNLQLPFLPPTVFPSLQALPSYNPILGGNWKTTGDLPPTIPTSPNINNPFKLNAPSSVGVNSFGSSYRSLGANYGSIPQRSHHVWIQCDGCGVTPITGPRFKSNVKENYDLCGACFSYIENEAEYTRLDMPTSTSNMKIPGQTPAVKNDCHFIKDVTIPDGTPMAPSTPFTKIWRLRNSGSTMWPRGTHLVWVGGDHFACLSSVKLAISANGELNPSEETEVTVDFLAPAMPGRYISYWRLALPSGLKFGQRIWVCIQVEQRIQTSGINQAAAVDLNQLPEASSSKPKPFTFDMKCVPTNPFFGCPVSCGETMKPKESEPAPRDMSSAPTTAEQVQIPVAEAPGSSAKCALASIPAHLPASEDIPLPNPAPMPPGSTPSDTATVCVPAPSAAPTVPAAPINHLEEKLISDLEDLGFTQAELNRQILWENNYDLEQSVVDLCGFNEWEFSELVSDDTQICEEVVTVVDNSDDEGFIVTNIVTKGKEQ